MQFNSDGGTAQVGTAGFSAQRNTFVGLSGDWGTASSVVARHPGQIAFTPPVTKSWATSILDLNSGVAGVFTEVRANNAIAYVSRASPRLQRPPWSRVKRLLPLTAQCR